MTRLSSQLDIQAQPRLSILRQVELCLDGIRHRLFRSMVTLSIVVLAVAFLMNLLTETIVGQSLKEQVFPLARETRQLSEFVVFVTGPLDADRMRRQVISSHPQSWQAATYARWLDLEPGAFTAFGQQLEKLDVSMNWVDTLNPGHRLMLFEGQGGVTALLMLNEPDVLERVDTAMQQDVRLRLPEDILEVARTYPTLSRTQDEALVRINERLAALALDMRPAQFPPAMGQAAVDAERREALAALMARHDMVMDEAVLDELLAIAHFERQSQILRRAFEHPTASRAYQSQFGSWQDAMEVVAVLAREGGRRQWLLENGRWPQGENWDEAQIATVASTMLEHRAMVDFDEQIAATYGRAMELDTSFFWLMIVSLLVCAVGITNALLMSVLERFREIATMKCLGALDGFIAVLFLLEAAVLGLVGGAIGAAVGLLLGLGRVTLSFGPGVWSWLPWMALLQAVLFAIVVGVLLAVVAAIYPAWRASLMPPMQAMRVE